MQKTEAAPSWIKKNRLLAAAIVISLSGLVILFLYAANVSPASKSIGSIGKGDIGNLVETEGYIRNVRFNSGGANIMLVDIATNKSIAVFVPGDVLPITNDTRIQPGAKVSVRGIVEEYQGEVEIVLRIGSNLKALESAGKLFVPIHELAVKPGIYWGMSLWTRGTVRDARVVSGGGAQPVGTAFLLDSTSNGTYSLHCIIFGADLTGLQALKTGSTTSFMGRFDWYDGGNCWQLDADSADSLTPG